MGFLHLTQVLELSYQVIAVTCKGTPPTKANHLVPPTCSLLTSYSIAPGGGTTCLRHRSAGMQSRRTLSPGLHPEQSGNENSVAVRVVFAALKNRYGRETECRRC